MQTWQIFAAVVVAVAIVLIVVLLAIRARRNSRQRHHPTVEPPRDRPQGADQANPPPPDDHAGPGTHPPTPRGEAEPSLFDDVPTSPVGGHQVDTAAEPDRDDRTIRLPASGTPQPDQAEPAAIGSTVINPSVVDPTATTNALPVVGDRSHERRNGDGPEQGRPGEPHRHARPGSDDLLVPISVVPAQGPGGRHRASTGSAATEPEGRVESTEPVPAVPAQRGRSEATGPVELPDDQHTEPRGGRVVPDHPEPADLFAAVAPPGDHGPVMPQQNVGPMPSGQNGDHDSAADVTTAIPRSDATPEPPADAPTEDRRDPDEGRHGRSMADRLLGRRR